MRFKEYGLESFEVVDNGSGIPPEDYDSIGECVILTSRRIACGADITAVLHNTVLHRESTTMISICAWRSWQMSKKAGRNAS